MRVVGGRLRGRAIVAPVHAGTRPTSDRVRESIFNILAHGTHGFAIEGANVLDLFAGTGALGLEALSRGAKFCMFVDDDADARGIIRENVEAFGLTGVTKIFRRDATDLGAASRHAGFTLIFADPPYGHGLGERALRSAAAGGWLAPGALAVVEERRGAIAGLPDGYTRIDARSWGDTEVVFARYGARDGSAA